MGTHWALAKAGVALLVLGVSASVLLGEAFTVPVSDELIEGSLFIGSSAKASARFEAREGSMVTVRDERDGSWYGVTPILDESRQLSFTAFRIFDLGDGNQELQQIVFKRAAEDEAFTAVPVGSAAAVPIQGTPLAIRVQSVEPRNFVVKAGARPLSKARPGQLHKMFGASGGGLCSITCTGITVTATGVQMSCGQCESGAFSSAPH